MALLRSVPQPDDEGLPVLRPNWRVEPQSNLSHNEAATYRRVYHAPRMVNMAAAGLKECSSRFAALSAEDEGLAMYYTQWERRLANGLIDCIGRYLSPGGY